ncbi:MAG: OmpA family protein [Holosporales bacterium]|jgi:peptidoglycan-associated lipoprotein|nr:OmpA family protein [Holosporales bacterium]
MFKFKNLVAVVGIGLFLVSCSHRNKDVDSVSSSTGPGTAADFDQNVKNTVYFGFDRYDLIPEARDSLLQVTSWLKMYTSRNITVEGHCDKRGTTDYNLALGSRRAESAKSFLVENGVEASRVTTISYGKESLISQGDTGQDHALNRRAHIIVIE